MKTTSESIDQSSFDSIDLKQLRADIDTAIAELPIQMRRIFKYEQKDVKNIYFTRKYKRTDSLETILKEIGAIHHLMITKKG